MESETLEQYKKAKEEERQAYRKALRIRQLDRRRLIRKNWGIISYYQGLIKLYYPTLPSHPPISHGNTNQ